MGSSSILNLNDDCFLYIFQYLGIRDQINVADTCLRFQQIFLHSTSAIYSVSHPNDPIKSKPVLYYSSAAFRLFKNVKNNVATLGIIQGHGYDKEELGNAVKDFQVLRISKNKIHKHQLLENFTRSEDLFRFSKSGPNYLSINVPSCICYLEEFFKTIPDLKELRVAGYAKCSESVKIILKCFPNLSDLSIRGGCLRERSDFALISQMKRIEKLSLNVGGPNCLDPLSEMSELRSIYLESIFSYISPEDIIRIIQNCKKLEFLYCYYINHGDHPQESIGNLFRMIKSSRDPSKQKPLQLLTYLDPPISQENVCIPTTTFILPLV
ncbi:hypothetical protein KR018_011768 [Drosophila ironensis]|nr:hypothetical protein KR018_011768 [Drosophila ironensis]